MEKNSQKENQHKGHLLSIDIESWIFSRKIDSKKLSVRELRKLDNNYVPNVLKYLLKTLKKYDQKTSFFIVGKLEEIYPGTIEKILEAGHEVGWHTHSHAYIANEEVLKRELDASSKIIQKYKLRGFQAPLIIFFKKGYKILKDYGFEYSSSIYGNSSIVHNFDGVYEIPVTTSSTEYNPKRSEIFFPANMSVSNIKRFGIPIGSSYFWSIFGKKYYHRRLENATEKNHTINMFIHDWQIIRPDSKEYHKDVGFMWNPLFYPYKKSVANMYEYILENHRLRRFIDLIKDEKKRK